MAKPSAFSFTVGATLIAAKASGSTHAQAAADAGIAQRTLRSWLSQGRAGREPFATFLRAFEQAEHRAQRAAVDAEVAKLRTLAVA